MYKGQIVAPPPPLKIARCENVAVSENRLGQASGQVRIFVPSDRRRMEFVRVPLPHRSAGDLWISELSSTRHVPKRAY